MAAIIVDGGTNATGTHVASGTTEVIASGAFGSASVAIYVDADGQTSAPVYTFGAPGAISVQAASGTNITAVVVGGQSPVIDVTMNP